MGASGGRSDWQIGRAIQNRGLLDLDMAIGTRPKEPFKLQPILG